MEVKFRLITPNGVKGTSGIRLDFVNKAFEEMTGWSREEVIGKTPRIFQGANTDLSIFQNLRDMISKGEVREGTTIN